jgi:alpha-1,2-mannosyltransferase
MVFMASAATLSATLLARSPPLPLHGLHEYHLFDDLHDYRFFDLKIYRRAAEVVSHARPLYAAKLKHGLGFTYPPFAVLLFLCLRWLPVRGDELAVTIINLALVAVIAHVSLRLRRSHAERERAPRRYARRRRTVIAAGWLIAAVALWAEPITTTLGYGQIDLLITACVVVDLVYGERSRAGGLGIGLAAALKLTPLVFIPYLALTGRGWMAARALAAFLVSIAVALLVIPGDATTYWFGGKFMDLSRVTGANPHAGAGAANQSLRGALLRILPGTSHLTLIWLLASVAVAALGLLLAVRAARRGDEAWGFMLVALTGLLICPVSWTHHWTIAAAGAIALLGSRRRPALTALKAAAAIAFVAGSSAIWFVIRLGPEPHLGATGLLLGNLYVFIGLATVAAAAALELRHAVGRGGRVLHSPHQHRLPQRLRVIPETPVRAITTSQALAPDRQS